MNLNIKEMAKEITAFETTDGKIFTDKKEAQKHDLEIERKSKLTAIISEGFYRDMDESSIVNLILENKDEIFTILSAKIW